MIKKLTILALLMTPLLSHATVLPVQSGHFYVIGDLGYSYLFSPRGAIGTTTNEREYTDGSLGGSLGGGYFFALDSFTALGGEIDYLYNGEANYNSNPKFTSSGPAILLTLSTLWQNGINLFGKAGVADIFQSQDYSNPTNIDGTIASGSKSSSSAEFVGVLGLGYMLTQHINLFIDGTYTGGTAGGSWQSTTASDNAIVASAQVKIGLSDYF